jgi:formylglycine-generating enzyme required for sulfatase activity
MVKIPGGNFMMGSHCDSSSSCNPAHSVNVAPFQLDVTEVTVAAFKACVDVGRCLVPPSERYCNWGVDGHERHPINCVDWEQARTYCAFVGKRLPTEAEWEFAARSRGLKQRFSGTSSAENLPDYAWYEDNSEMKTHPVGTKKPNGLGIYDMSGNVMEWCADRYDRHYYRQSPRSNPKGDPFGINRTLRGGSAGTSRSLQRASYRDYVAPTVRGDLFGLRLALDGAPAI